MEEMNMREMTKTERKEIEFEVSEIMGSAVSSEYSRYILEQEDDVGHVLVKRLVGGEVLLVHDDAAVRLRRAGKGQQQAKKRQQQGQMLFHAGIPHFFLKMNSLEKM